MADVKCPMCGKQNPPELDTCQFCQARLKPLLGPTPEEGQESRPHDRRQEPADWLSALRQGSEAEPGAPGGDRPDWRSDEGDEGRPAVHDHQEDLDEGPEWLGRLRDDQGWQRDEQEGEDYDLDLGESEDELLDRLEDFEGEESPPREERQPVWSPEFVEPEEPPEEAEPGLPGWLTGEPASGEQEVGEGGLPEWLESDDLQDIPREALETKEIPELADQELPFEDQERVPKWMQDLATEGPRDQVEPQPDWFEEPAGEPESEEAGPDWLGGEPGGPVFPEPLETKDSPELDWDEGEEELDNGELPDWLQGPGEDFTAGPGVESPAEDGEELPDWLKETPPDQGFMEPDEASEAEFTWEPAETEPSAKGPEIPEWLLSAGLEPDFLGEGASAQFPTPTDEGEDFELDSGDEELPTWLQSSELEEAFSEPSQTKELPELSGAEEFETELPSEEGQPDWLAEFAEEEQQPPTSPEPPRPPWMAPEDEQAESPMSLEEGDVPDWLRNLQSVQEQALSETESGVFTEFDSLIGDLAAEGEQEAPSWLADLQARSPEVPVEPDEALPPADAPSRMPEPEGEAEAAMPGELPEWISDISREEAFEQTEFERVEDELELTPAELPGWLKAMRPVEAVAPLTPPAKKPDQGVEKAGPLAGLEGVLSAESQMVQAGSPSTISTRVQVSESQYSHINLLKSLLSAEAEVRPSGRRRAVQPQRILRWLIAAGLILAVLLPLFSQSQTAPLPSLFPPETLAVGETINALSPDSLALVAFDYQPALSGELEAAATPVLDHLMIRGARFVLASTSPVGPALGQRFLESGPGLGMHAYAHGQQYLNLGYISGGPAGLLNFAANPRGTLPEPFTRAGVQDQAEIWDLPLLQGVRSVADFSLLLVIVDDSETARAWIEQVGPRLEDTPLVMVISAQAEPLVRPYYEAIPRQVRGLVTGLAGGAAYEQIINRSHLARNYWDAFSNGLLMAELLILLGGAYNVFTVLFRRREPAPVEGEA